MNAVTPTELGSAGLLPLILARIPAYRTLSSNPEARIFPPFASGAARFTKGKRWLRAFDRRVLYERLLPSKKNRRWQKKSINDRVADEADFCGCA